MKLAPEAGRLRRDSRNSCRNVIHYSPAQMQIFTTVPQFLLPQIFGLATNCNSNRKKCNPVQKAPLPAAPNACDLVRSGKMRGEFGETSAQSHFIQTGPRARSSCSSVAKPPGHFPITRCYTRERASVSSLILDSK